MSQSSTSSNRIYQGMALAAIAAFIWSGNFIVARAVIRVISPVSLAFLRWLTASIVLFPICLPRMKELVVLVKKHFIYFFFLSLFGITLFNTFVYVAGHYSSAINLALIGTTSSPIFATILAGIFLREKTRGMQLVGLLVCIAGILLLLSKGDLHTLLGFRFSRGDWWVLAGSMAFAIYNVLVRKNPVKVKGLDFLFITFSIGTLLLLPAFAIDRAVNTPIEWSGSLVMIILYLGVGASAVCYLCWNASIARLGASRTAIFGNLIPIFSTLEAVVILNEQLLPLHIISGFIVIGGLLLANLFNKGARSTNKELAL
ncbi:MAG TPA: DMT family transporter [Flavitalea sp.]|nr:DMT family transporter [Flavitalea sp.]